MSEATSTPRTMKRIAYKEEVSHCGHIAIASNHTSSTSQTTAMRRIQLQHASHTTSSRQQRNIHPCMKRTTTNTMGTTAITATMNSRHIVVIINGTRNRSSDKPVTRYSNAKTVVALSAHRRVEGINVTTAPSVSIRYTSMETHQVTD